MKKNMNKVLMTGKYFRNGLVLMNIKAANSIIAKYPNRIYPTPASIGWLKNMFVISRTIV